MMEGIHWTIRNQHEREKLIGQINRLGLPFSCKLTDAHLPHTGQQMRYVHSLINALALYCGVSTEIAKRDAKVEWGITVVHRSIVTGEKTARLMSFKDYTRKQLTEFISHLEAYLDQEGVEYIASTGTG